MELIRYIHLNPLRAKLVEDLKDLDKYPWTGHSAILGRRKNPLIPETVANDSTSAEGGLSFSLSSGKGKKQKQYPANPVNPACPVALVDGTGVRNISLAEKTVEDVLRHFGGNLKEACCRYRQFVKKGMKHGRREDLQGGGLIRSSGGDKAILIGQKKEYREKSDQRILGSGDFVSNVLKNANENAERKAGCNISLAELIRRVCKKFDIKTAELMLDTRRVPYTQARVIISYLSIHELGYRGSDVAKALNISRASVSKAMSRGEKMIDKNQRLWDLLKIS